MKTALTLSIVVGDMSCNNSCPFCIGKMTPHSPEMFEQEINWTKFRKAINIAKHYKVGTILLTGKGEPTLHPFLITKYLAELREAGFNRIELQTDGMTLLDMQNAPNHLDLWKHLGLDLVAISVYHYNGELNNQVYMNPKSREPEELEHMIKIYKSYGFDIRLTAVLLKGYLDSVTEIENLLAFAKKHDVMQVTIRPVGHPSNLNPKWMRIWKKYFTGTVEIEEYFKENFTVVDRLPHGAVVFDIDGSNLCLCDCLTKDWGDDDIRQLIWFGNGWLTTNWEYPESARIM